ncbi:hypothetical protein AeNC1_004225 [Aphanomyces euteiches]|nr:hypothetical protein AeNC1_004225 [Aphanomyces euteiches]
MRAGLFVLGVVLTLSAFEAEATSARSKPTDRRLAGYGGYGLSARPPQSGFGGFRPKPVQNRGTGYGGAGIPPRFKPPTAIRVPPKFNFNRGTGYGGQGIPPQYRATRGATRQSFNLGGRGGRLGGPGVALPPGHGGGSRGGFAPTSSRCLAPGSCGQGRPPNNGPRGGGTSSLFNKNRFVAPGSGGRGIPPRFQLSSNPFSRGATARRPGATGRFLKDE